MVWWVWFVGCGVVFDTPVVACVFNGFGSVCGGWGCVVGRVRVSYSLAAAQRVVPFLGGCEVGEWWWFENSRACLYYFFIVNDCQFIPRLIACRGGRVPGRV